MRESSTEEFYEISLDDSSKPINAIEGNQTTLQWVYTASKLLMSAANLKAQSISDDADLEKGPDEPGVQPPVLFKCFENRSCVSEYIEESKDLECGNGPEEELYGVDSLGYCRPPSNESLSGGDGYGQTPTRGHHSSRINATQAGGHQTVVTSVFAAFSAWFNSADASGHQGCREEGDNFLAAYAVHDGLIRDRVEERYDDIETGNREDCSEADAIVLNSQPFAATPTSSWVSLSNQVGAGAYHYLTTTWSSQGINIHQWPDYLMHAFRFSPDLSSVTSVMKFLPRLPALTPPATPPQRHQMPNANGDRTEPLYGDRGDDVEVVARSLDRAFARVDNEPVNTGGHRDKLDQPHLAFTPDITVTTAPQKADTVKAEPAKKKTQRTVTFNLSQTTASQDEHKASKGKSVKDVDKASAVTAVKKPLPSDELSMNRYLRPLILVAAAACLYFQQWPALCLSGLMFAMSWHPKASQLSLHLQWFAGLLSGLHPQLQVAGLLGTLGFTSYQSFFAKKSTKLGKLQGAALRAAWFALLASTAGQSAIVSAALTLLAFYLPRFAMKTEQGAWLNQLTEMATWAMTALLLTLPLQPAVQAVTVAISCLPGLILMLHDSRHVNVVKAAAKQSSAAKDLSQNTAEIEKYDGRAYDMHSNLGILP